LKKLSQEISACSNMAACGGSKQEEITSKSGKTMSLNVRVVEAAGLVRHTTLKINKSVTIYDPCCTLQLRDVDHKATSSKQNKTKTVKGTCFPYWDQTFNIPVHGDDIAKKDSVLRFQVEGAQKLGNEVLGTVDILISEIYEKCDKMKTGCWQKWLHMSKRSPPTTTLAGALLVVFSFTNKKETPRLLNFDSEEKTELETGILIGSFNAGNEAPPENIEDWLQPDPEKHEIVVVGCQECNWKLSDDEKEKDKDGDCETIFANAVKDALNKRAKEDNPYRILTMRSMHEMRLYVFVLRSCLERNKISHYSHYQEATGVGHVLANKGGIVVAFDIGGTSLAFINTHLAAHQNESDRRNADYTEVAGMNGVGNTKTEMLEQFHHVFWMGDLNYRVDYKPDQQTEKEPPKAIWDEYVSFIEKKDYAPLLKHDQLTRVRMDGTAFYGFQEAAIHFQPTFKVQKQKPYEYIPKRSPAWCDRVLWKSAHACEKDVVCTAYTSGPRVISSDHKPVAATFQVRTWPRSPGKVDPPQNAKASKKIKHIKATLQLRNVSAKNLPASDVLGKCDPFIHFPRSEILEKYQKSDKLKNTLNPQWENKQLPSLSLLRTNPTFLKKAILQFQIKDHDMLSKADRIASGNLGLGPVVLSPGQWIAFERPLTHSGKPAGTIKGEYMINFSQ